MHFSDLTGPEQRVLGCLIEKRFTTPDHYPLTVNALRSACNQSTNRDPVVAYDETTVQEAANRLTKYGLARLASGHSSRSVKYRHLAEDALGLNREQLAVLCVLLLRGPQTHGELKLRTERMVAFADLAAVDAVLTQLSERGYATRIVRRPGQKDDRFAHTLGELQVAEAAPPVAAPDVTAASTGAEPAAPSASEPALEARVRALESAVAELQQRLGDVPEAS